MNILLAVRFSFRLFSGWNPRGGSHHDQTSGVAARCVDGGRSLGFGHFRPVGPEPAADLQRGCLADASVPAGFIWLLLPGHGGIQGGYLQWLRRGSERAAAADRRSQRGLEEKGLKNVDLEKDFVETFERLIEMHGLSSHTAKCLHLKNTLLLCLDMKCVVCVWSHHQDQS